MSACTAPSTTSDHTHAEFPVGNEVLPLVDSLELAGVGTSVDETADGVTRAGGAVGVELTTVVALLDVDLGEVSSTGNLDVRWCLQKVRS